MAGNWRVNAILGLTAFLFTYLFSYMNNMWLTSLLRAGLGFLLFFALGYIFRFLLQQIGSEKNAGLIQKQKLGKGTNSGTDQKNEIEEELIDDSSFQSTPLQSLHSGEDI